MLKRFFFYKHKLAPELRRMIKEGLYNETTP